MILVFFILFALDLFYNLLINAPIEEWVTLLHRITAKIRYIDPLFLQLHWQINQINIFLMVHLPDMSLIDLSTKKVKKRKISTNKMPRIGIQPWTNLKAWIFNFYLFRVLIKTFRENPHLEKLWMSLKQKNIKIFGIWTWNLLLPLILQKKWSLIVRILEKENQWYKKSQNLQ